MGFTDYSYIPILGVRQAEMRALEELAPQVKETLLPFVVLQPWATANELARTVARVNAAVGLRTIVADITEPIPFKGKRRPVHDAFDLLRNPEDGYQNYVEFIKENENFLPALQLTNLGQIDAQIVRLADLGRDVTVRLQEPMLRYAGDIAGRFKGIFPSDRIHFILDFEKQNREILVKSVTAISTIQNIRAVLPDCSISVSASTLPENFVGISHQDIFERQFHEVVSEAIGYENAIYCDRGSARAEALGGGSGTPAPRIDLANTGRWHFFRVDDAADKNEGFRKAAKDAMGAACWDDLGIWGTEYIKRTADQDETDIIDTATKCTAARINIHLHIQATGGESSSMDEVGWTD